MKTDEPAHVFRIGKYLPAWKGRTCTVLARGRLNSVLVRFSDNGQRAITNRMGGQENQAMTDDDATKGATE